MRPFNIRLTPPLPPGPLKRNIEDVFFNEFYFINYFISKFQIKYVIDRGYIFALVTQYNYFNMFYICTSIALVDVSYFRRKVE